MPVKSGLLSRIDDAALRELSVYQQLNRVNMGPKYDSYHMYHNLGPHRRRAGWHVPVLFADCSGEAVAEGPWKQGTSRESSTSAR